MSSVFIRVFETALDVHILTGEKENHPIQLSFNVSLNVDSQGGLILIHPAYSWVEIRTSEESPDPTHVRNDVPTDLGTTRRDGLRRGMCNKAEG